MKRHLRSSLCALLFVASAVAGGSARATAASSPFVVQADVVLGDACISSSVFHPGDDIVWRATVRNRADGTPLTAAQIEQLGVKLVVDLPGGRVIPLHFGKHPPAEVKSPVRSAYWSGSYHVAENHATGTLPWTAVATDAAGHRTTFEPIGQKVGAAVLTIVPGPRPAK